MNIAIHEITEEGTRIPDLEAFDLGAHSLEEILKEANASHIASLLKPTQPAEKTYMLSWRGYGRVPRGAAVGGWLIGFTQDGEVKTQEGKQIGYYKRVLDCVENGEISPVNVMVVFITKVNHQTNE